MDKVALQLAVWEALYDTGATVSSYGFGSGRFGAAANAAALTDGASAIAEALIWLGETRTTSYAGYLLLPDDGYSQGVLGGVTPVPEPTTMIAGALLLVPFGASTLRVLRRNQPLEPSNSRHSIANQRHYEAFFNDACIGRGGCQYLESRDFTSGCSDFRRCAYLYTVR